MTLPLLGAYAPDGSAYDELLQADGALRPHWRPLAEELADAAPEALARLGESANQQVLQNGVTYNIYADPQGADRPWALDPLPHILPADEWAGIADAIAQRATLLNAMLADLYGPQRLVAEGLYPPALVFGHSGYLAACRGALPPGATHLHLYAADLARAPDGRWWVIADRTQAPSGAGYALENRLIVSRIFPDLFREQHIEHLAGFFRTLKETLAGGAPCAPGETPLVVLLTPGPYNETYFEHAYLARYLGFPLVEGQDLTVRDDTVYLKTLTGLKRVHAILRRLDDDFCDPLELRSDSALGVSGLLQAVRAGRVLVANALGSGVLQTGGAAGFLPAICARLLGEPLQMPSVATWWCGEPPALDYTLAHLDELVVKPVFPGQTMAPVFGDTLTPGERARLVERLKARPYAYMAQELVRLSQAPVLAAGPADGRPGGALAARSVGLRVFAVATPGGGYTVMPGGLTRVAGAADVRVLTMQRGGASKDTWITAAGPVSGMTLLKPSVALRDLVRQHPHLSSRVVENLFWFGRYAERCTWCARLLRLALTRFISADADTRPALALAFDLAQGFGLLAPEEALEGRADTGRALVAAVVDVSRPSGLATDLRRLHWAATQVRERLSGDHWHALNTLNQSLAPLLAQPGGEPGKERDRERGGRKRGPARSGSGEALAVIDRALDSLAAITGFAMDEMTRDHGWRFLVIGRRLERLVFMAQALARFLRLPGAREASGLDALLELADSSITYRTRYLRSAELLPVLDLLVRDETNPHAVAFQLQVVGRYLARLAESLPGPDAWDCRPLLADAEACLAAIDFARFEGGGRGGAACADLADALDAVAGAAMGVSERLGLHFFSHVRDVGRTVLA